MSDEARATERPATFREVFASREFSAVFVAFGLSWFGDYLAKAAVTALVFQRTESVALSAATFALSYMPWLVGGPLLSTLADRYPYRKAMITCDIIRMVTIGLVAVPGMPVEAMLVLLFVTALANPPAQASRSALMPLMLSHDRLVVGLALSSSCGQAAQVGGYLVGAAMAPFFPELALLIDAGTFGLSAMLIRLGVQARPAANPSAPRRHLLAETGEGFQLVFSTPILRSIAILVFSVMLFTIVPEGLAAGWAKDVSGSHASQGLNQGLIMTASPIGVIAGSLLISRLVGPSRRQALVRPFAILAPASLVPALVHPPVLGIAVMAAACGFAVAGLMPTANGLFVQALPHGYRARAFGVMQTGVQLMQGFAVLGTGLLADLFDIPTVVGVWSLGGVLLMLVISAWWPSPQRFSSAIAAAGAKATMAAATDTAEGSGPAGPKTSSSHTAQNTGLGTPQTTSSGEIATPTTDESVPVALIEPDGRPTPPATDVFPSYSRPPSAAAPGHLTSWAAGGDRMVPPRTTDAPESTGNAGRHNTTVHRGGRRGPVIRDEASPLGGGRNAGPRSGDELPIRPTSPASDAGASS